MRSGYLINQRIRLIAFHVETALVSGKEKWTSYSKSLKLMQEIIKIHTNKDDLILTIYGSGTTGAAAISLGRKFIGIEKNPEFYKLKRMN